MDLPGRTIVTDDAFETDLAKMAAEVGRAFDALLAAEAVPDRLLSAMRYAALGPGKRLRPYLVLKSAALFSADAGSAMRAACALECVHAYSLVHDDLPAMDDDDLRRGRATAHRAYDEATAILAGDALLTEAFAILADPATHPDGAVRAGLVARLAEAAGARGMVGGQMIDLEAEGRFAADGAPLRLGEAGIARLQAMKTGALFRFAAVAGPVLAAAPDADVARLATYGEALGRAFQIADDILDEEASAEELGKATAKDRERGKATLPAALGIAAARERLDAAVAEARAALEPYGARAAPLAAAAAFAANRRR